MFLGDTGSAEEGIPLKTRALSAGHDKNGEAAERDSWCQDTWPAGLIMAVMFLLWKEKLAI